MSFTNVLDIRINLARERLTNEAEGLAKSLMLLVKELRSDDFRACSVNVRGVIQGQAASVDTAAAQLATLLALSEEYAKSEAAKGGE